MLRYVMDNCFLAGLKADVSPFYHNETRCCDMSSLPRHFQILRAKKLNARYVSPKTGLAENCSSPIMLWS